jgi:hypothetical protein
MRESVPMPLAKSFCFSPIKAGETRGTVNRWRLVPNDLG